MNAVAFLNAFFSSASGVASGVGKTSGAACGIYASPCVLPLAERKLQRPPVVRVATDCVMLTFISIISLAFVDPGLYIMIMA